MPRKRPPQPPEEPERPEEPEQPEEHTDSGVGDHMWGDWRKPDEPLPIDIAELDTAILSGQEVQQELARQRRQEIVFHRTQARALREAAAALEEDIRRAYQLEHALAERYRRLLQSPPQTLDEMRVGEQWLAEFGSSVLARFTLEQERSALLVRVTAHEFAAAEIRRATAPPKRPDTPGS